jgi:hypothetical protein
MDTATAGVVYAKSEPNGFVSVDKFSVSSFQFPEKERAPSGVRAHLTVDKFSVSSFQFPEKERAPSGARVRLAASGARLRA